MQLNHYWSWNTEQDRAVMYITVTRSIIPRCLHTSGVHLSSGRPQGDFGVVVWCFSPGHLPLNVWIWTYLDWIGAPTSFLFMWFVASAKAHVAFIVLLAVRPPSNRLLKSKLLQSLKGNRSGENGPDGADVIPTYYRGTWCNISITNKMKFKSYKHSVFPTAWIQMGPTGNVGPVHW